MVATKTEVTNISPFGIWILTNDKEYFISYKDYPVFENASIKQIAAVTTDFSGNLHWEELDADAVLAAYGFSTKMTESECVAELFKMYESLTKSR